MFMEKMSDPSDIYLHNVLLCSSQRRKGYVGTISRDKYLGPETRIRVSSVVTWIWAISGISIIKGCPHKRIKFSLILASGSRIFNSKLHFFTKYFSKMRSLMHHYRTYKDFKACSMVHYSTTKYLFIGVSKCSLRRKKNLSGCLLHEAFFHGGKTDFILHTNSKWLFEPCANKGLQSQVASMLGGKEARFD